MQERLKSSGKSAAKAQKLPTSAPQVSALKITLDVEAGVVRFEWLDAKGHRLASGSLEPSEARYSPWVLEYFHESSAGTTRDGCYARATSVRALLSRIRKRFIVPPAHEKLGLLTSEEAGIAKAGVWLQLKPPPQTSVWTALARHLLDFAAVLEKEPLASQPRLYRGTMGLHLVTCAILGVDPRSVPVPRFEQEQKMFSLRVTFNQIEGFAEFNWRAADSNETAVLGRIHCSAPRQLTWTVRTGGESASETSLNDRNAIRSCLANWLKRFPTSLGGFRAFWVSAEERTGKPVRSEEPPLDVEDHPFPWLEDNIVQMAEVLSLRFSPLGKITSQLETGSDPDFARYARRWERKQQNLAEQEQLRLERMAVLAEERRRREEQKAEARAKALGHERVVGAERAKPHPHRPTVQQTPPVPVHIQMPDLEFQETLFANGNLKAYQLRETAARWWISNQSDDLLCLPHCRIQHLEYQIRTALRVLGPLRGRALLSDEVGLGKTIEAGLVIKELVVRGMARRILVLTVPSLVDQWEEELNEKFGLPAATTNQTVARDNPEKFWNENTTIVASLHTLKQAAHLAVAQKLTWDILVVDEAHYLRNRDSQAWRAVSALPRQFLLLLTATPVQNSLEELYNLVTLLQPGFLPSPREFRTRFLDPKRPRQPREPEELRRMLSQVMIRNTRANAGVALPPRRAETVLFEPGPAEKAFRDEWEADFRVALGEMNPSQSSLWGRLLLQAAGSSPAAWRSALSRFPNRGAAERWSAGALLSSSWDKKCALIPPLTHAEGGVVVFTQFLQTQSALAEFLRGAGIQTHVINGQTPPADRQPITEDFRRHGGVLLLTHSGTEGRNLQFCHRLVNFDLPWNPMEIEQRIGRLHRLGQKHPVRIFNLVQSGTLQEHLLELLQEKLNLFELVVGETGLVLGERFSSDEFAEEILRCWRESQGRVGEALSSLGEELAAAREQYGEIKKLDETLFAKDYALI